MALAATKKTRECNKECIEQIINRQSVITCTLNQISMQDSPIKIPAALVCGPKRSINHPAKPSRPTATFAKAFPEVQ